MLCKWVFFFTFSTALLYLREQIIASAWLLIIESSSSLSGNALSSGTTSNPAVVIAKYDTNHSYLLSDTKQTLFKCILIKFAPRFSISFANFAYVIFICSFAFGFFLNSKAIRFLYLFLYNDTNALKSFNSSPSYILFFISKLPIPFQYFWCINLLVFPFHFIIANLYNVSIFDALFFKLWCYSYFIQFFMQVK